MTTRAALNQAAARVAAQYGWRLKEREPKDRNRELKREGLPRYPSGYFQLTWTLTDSQGQTQGYLVLECMGGYGSGPGKAWYASHVSVTAVHEPDNMLLIHKLVHQWDFPCKGAQSAQATRSRFVTWADQFKIDRQKA